MHFFALALFACAATAQLVPDCTTMKDFVNRGLKTTNLPVATQTVSIVSTPTSTITKTIRAPRTVMFTSVVTSMTTSVVMAPTPTQVVTVTPTSFVIEVPKSTSYAPTFTPPDSTITIASATATTTILNVEYSAMPTFYIEAALSPTPSPLILKRDGEGDRIRAQLAARAGPLGGRAIDPATGQHQRAIGRIVQCQATATETQTTQAATPFLVTKMMLSRPTARKTTTMVFTATSTSTPAGTVNLQTAPAATSTLTATETITMTVTPTIAAATTTINIPGPDATQYETRSFSGFCSEDRQTWTSGSYDNVNNLSGQYLSGSWDTRVKCCDAVSKIEGAISYWYSPGACWAATAPTDQCVAGSNVAKNAFNAYSGSGWTFGLLQCTTAFSRA